jgi:glutaredoxin 3
MADVEIYTTATCPYCLAAKRLLTQKGVDFREIPVDGNRAARAAMTERASGRRTVPQIFVDGKHIGGCDDLHALDREGGLDPLLQATGAAS